MSQTALEAPLAPSKYDRLIAAAQAVEPVWTIVAHPATRRRCAARWRRRRWA
jgi:hypothetical protein